MDFFADNHVRRVIGELIKNGGTIKTNEAIWFQMTKCMISQYGLAFVLEQLEQINYEVSDEQWFENKYPEEIFREKFVRSLLAPKKVYTKKGNDKLKNLINTKLKITEVAKSYGLDTDKRGRTTCPFHNDSEPSCNLNDELNIFHCFGCGAKGDLITFIKRMEEMKIGDKERGGTTSN